MKRFASFAAVVLLLLLGASISFAQDTESTVLATGDEFILQGQLQDTTGAAIADAVVQLWQADTSGQYDHSESTGTGELDAEFQYFGTATTTPDGYFAFLTVVPAASDETQAVLYLRVEADGVEAFDTQIFFEATEEADAFPVVEVEDAETSEGDAVITGNITLIVDTGVEGTLVATPVLENAPFFPEVDFAEFDNNLLSTADDDVVIAPIVEDTPAVVESADLSGRILYRIIPEESLVSFVMQEDLRGERIDVIGTTNQVAGDFIIDFDDPFFSQLGTIRINARTLETDNEFRDRAIRAEILLSARDEYEFIEFVPAFISDTPFEINLNEPYTFSITGDLEITGVVQEVVFDTEGLLESPDRVTGTASTVILYADWGISIPSAPGVANISDDVTLTIDFVAERVEE